MKAAFSKAQFEAEFSSRFGTTLKPHNKSVAAAIPTGVSEVDTLTGGLPRGAVTEIFGVSSSGRTTLMLSTLAQATTRDEVCAVIDTTDAFDPAAAEVAGARLDRLLWLRCGAVLELAFKAADLLLQGGGFGLVFLDLGDVPAVDSRRIISSWWYRFRRVVENTPTSFVVLAQDSCVRSCASLTLETKNSAGLWSTTADSSPDVWASRKNFPLSVAHPIRNNPSSTESVPAHSHLLKGLHLTLHRQKPVNLLETGATFKAALSC
jgi:recombination protein RecA